MFRFWLLCKIWQNFPKTSLAKFTKICPIKKTFAQNILIVFNGSLKKKDIVRSIIHRTQSLLNVILHLVVIAGATLTVISSNSKHFQLVVIAEPKHSIKYSILQQLLFRVITFTNGKFIRTISKHITPKIN